MATKKSGEGGPARPARPRSKASEKAAPARKGASKTARPRIRASHAAVSESEGPKAARPRRTVPRRDVSTDAPARKTALAGPKRTGPRRSVPPGAPEASPAARDLAMALAGAGLDKKALGVEILDVSGRVDYADFLVVMTGRSDRHVHAIATGLEEAMRGRRVAPLSVEGLSAASWVLLDFADVVVHVFQEDARRLYDIEGLWIDANRVTVPQDPDAPGSQLEPH